MKVTVKTRKTIEYGECRLTVEADEGGYRLALTAEEGMSKKFTIDLYKDKAEALAKALLDISKDMGSPGGR